MKRIIDDVLKQFEQQRDNLIPILQAVQQETGYISEDAVEAVSGYLDISQSDIYGVATFYTQFRFTRPGDHVIKVCQGTACHVQGVRRIVDEAVRHLGIQPGETTDDYRFSLESVACFGSCALSPVVVVDDVVHGRMTPKKLKKLLKELSSDVPADTDGSEAELGNV